MPTMALESLKKTISEKYEPLTIDMLEAGKFDLVQVLRLGENDYNAFVKAQRELSAMQDDEDQVDENGEPIKLSPEGQEAADSNARAALVAKMRELILIPANRKDLCEKWLELIGDDLAALMEILDQYMTSTQVGEASASQSS